MKYFAITLILVLCGLFLLSFNTNPQSGHTSPYVQYDLDPSTEHYFVYVPADYTKAAKPYGLIVFTHAGDAFTELPDGWRAVFDQRHYIFVAAQQAGNDQPVNRRLGLAVMGAKNIMGQYHIDSSRVYATGFSGGARMSGLLGFFQSDLFRGTVQMSGIDFYKPVPVVAATTQLDTQGNPYGLLLNPSAESEITAAKNRVRFAIVTGSEDFRRGNILDIFHGGFEREGFKAKLFDVPGAGHEFCSAETLSQALGFLEGH